MKIFRDLSESEEEIPIFWVDQEGNFISYSLKPDDEEEQQWVVYYPPSEMPYYLRELAMTVDEVVLEPNEFIHSPPREINNYISVGYLDLGPTDNQISIRSRNPEDGIFWGNPEFDKRGIWGDRVHILEEKESALKVVIDKSLPNEPFDHLYIEHEVKKSPHIGFHPGIADPTVLTTIDSQWESVEKFKQRSKRFSIIADVLGVMNEGLEVLKSINLGDIDSDGIVDNHGVVFVDPEALALFSDELADVYNPILEGYVSAFSKDRDGEFKLKGFVHRSSFNPSNPPLIIEEWDDNTMQTEERINRRREVRYFDERYPSQSLKAIQVVEPPSNRSMKPYLDTSDVQFAFSFTILLCVAFGSLRN